MLCNVLRPVVTRLCSPRCARLWEHDDLVSDFDQQRKPQDVARMRQLA